MMKRCKMLKLLMSDPRFRGVRVLIIVFALLSFVTFFYQTISFTCQISILQNVLLPIIVVQQYILKMGWMPIGKRIRIGLRLGGIVGASIALFYLIVQDIQYYFFGWRELAYSTLSLDITEVTIQTVFVKLGTDVFILSGLTILSIISGIIASMFVTVVRPEKPMD